MKRYLTISFALVLVGWGGSALSVYEFASDQQNVDKYKELEYIIKKEHGCDKLSQLYDFTQLETPTVKDLSEIMPIFGLTANDASKADKVYNINFSVLNQYNCDDVGNTKQLVNDLVQYCNNKYPNAPDKQHNCEYYLKQSIFVFSKQDEYAFADDKRQVIQQVKSELEQGIMNNIQKIHPLPDDTEKFLPVFSANELIKARSDILGTYDGYCSSGDWLCEEDKTVTRLNAIRILYSVCKHSFRYLGEQPECVCYAHETYKKVNYQNLIYIDEKGGKLPQSKKVEFDQIFKKCKQKLEKQRYGETSDY